MWILRQNVSSKLQFLIKEMQFRVQVVQLLFVITKTDNYLVNIYISWE